MSKNPSFEDTYHTTAEAAAYLHLHPKTIRKKCLRGELRYDRVGRNGRWLRIKQSWLDQFAQEWRGTASDEGEQT
jgi:excisionase family DNA binding protein